MVRRSEGSQSITAAIKGKPRAGEGKKAVCPAAGKGRSPPGAGAEGA